MAESVGYKSYTNFTDNFRRLTGLTPLVYQKLAQEENGTSDPGPDPADED